jgi:hypothetical protein
MPPVQESAVGQSPKGSEEVTLNILKLTPRPEPWHHELEAAWIGNALMFKAACQWVELHNALEQEPIDLQGQSSHTC